VARNYAEAHTALNEALDIESTHPPRSDERISITLQMIADTYRAEGDLEKAAEYYSKVTAYSNLARRASQDLKETLDELERRRATLQAAHQSLALLERNDTTGIKDLAFIYALIAKSHASLNQPRESAETIRSLLGVLGNRRDSLKTDDEQADVRALAYLCDAGQAQETDDLPAARAACAAALEQVRNANLRWVIEQVARAVE